MAVTRINHFEGKQGQGLALRRFLESVIDTIRDAQGCRSVQLLEAVDHLDRFAIVEVWDSVEAHQAAAKQITPEKMKEASLLLATPAAGTYFHVIRDDTI